jgi:hypothetical protein
MDFANYWFSSAAGGGGYEIGNSLRFRGAQFLRKQRASDYNTSWSVSVWVKPATNSTGSSQNIMMGRDAGSPNSTLAINTSGQLVTTFNDSSSVVGYMRDPSAWYHIFMTSQGTDSIYGNIQLYVNGVLRQTRNSQYRAYFPASYHVLGIGCYGDSNAGYFNGFMAELHLISQGQEPIDTFGEFNDDGVWVPKEVSLSASAYGPGGFYLDFSDPSNIGADRSGAGNNIPATNFELTNTSSTNYDWMEDSPTTNWCTLNPLSVTSGTFSEANLKFVGASSWRKALGTVAVNRGKWYFESTLKGAPNSSRTSGSDYNCFGFIKATVFDRGGGIGGNTDCVLLGDNGYYTNFANSVTDVGALSNGDVLGCAIDLDGGNFQFFRNGTSLASGSLGAGYTSGEYLVPTLASYSSTYGPMVLNFGQRAFQQTVPSGYSALNTANLPAPDIADGSQYFNTVLYTATQTAQSITGVGFQPDLVWGKRRTGSSASHNLFDVLRGVRTHLQSNTTDADTTEAAGASLTSFDTDGFSVGTPNLGPGAINSNAGDLFVAWNWKAGGSGSSNTDGSINSTVSVNPTAKFSIVTYSGTGNGETVGHGLGVTPAFIITKSRNNSFDWGVLHHKAGTPGYSALLLNQNISLQTNIAYWNNTAPTSTTFSIGSTGSTGGASNNYIAYCFAEVENYSKFGSFTGNGSSNGPFVWCGFKPAWIMIKRTDSANDWTIVDSARDTYNPAYRDLYANYSIVEYSGASRPYDFLSNGFKIRENVARANESGGTYIYMAFSEHPFGGDGVSPATAR